MNNKEKRCIPASRRSGRGRRALAAALAAAALAGCAPQSSAPVAEADTLAVYCCGGYQPRQMAQYAADLFKGQHPGVTVEVTEIASEDVQRVRTEIMAGRGPDVLIQSGSTWVALAGDQELLIPDPDKAIAAGVFADCTDVVAALAGEDACLPAALEAGAVDGRQYVAPLFLQMWYTVENPEAGLPGDGSLLRAPRPLDDTLAFFDTALEVAEARGLLAAHPGYDWPLLFPLLYPNLSGMEDFSALEPFFTRVRAAQSHADRLVGRANFQNPSFGLGTGTQLEQPLTGTDLPEEDAEAVDRILSTVSAPLYDMVFSRCSAFGGLVDFQRKNTPAVIVPLHSDSGGQTAVAKWWAGILASSAKKDLAGDFLALLLGEGFQNYMAVQNHDVPVRTGSVARLLKQDAEQYFGADAQGFDLPVTAEDYCAFEQGNWEDINWVLLSNTAHQNVWQQFQPYLNGQQDFAACANEAYRAYRLYLEE